MRTENCFKTNISTPTDSCTPLDHMPQITKSRLSLLRNKILISINFRVREMWKTSKLLVYLRAQLVLIHSSVDQ